MGEHGRRFAWYAERVAGGADAAALDSQICAALEREGFDPDNMLNVS